MTTITTVYPDGTTETRELTPEEIAANERDAGAPLETAWRELRRQRDALLTNSDWTVLADSPTPTAAWKAYRQQLRDLPANTIDPFNPVWPTAPA